jgi:hypothetical protein
MITLQGLNFAAEERIIDVRTCISTRIKKFKESQCTAPWFEIICVNKRAGAALIGNRAPV